VKRIILQGKGGERTSRGETRGMSEGFPSRAEKRKFQHEAGRGRKSKPFTPVSLERASPLGTCGEQKKDVF